MPRARDPNRDKAFELWKNSQGKITNRALATMLDVPEKTISAWKSRDKWNAVLQTNECSTTNEKNKPQKKKRSGNPSPVKKFTERNTAALKHGLFSRYMPDETLKIMGMIAGSEPVDLLWMQIELQFAAIVRAQQIMFVEDKDEITKEIKKIERREDDFGVTEKQEWEIQFAWDKQATFINAQSRAMGELRSLIKQFLEMATDDDERRLKLEAMTVGIEKTRAEIARINSGASNSDADDWVSALKGVAEKRKSQRVSGDVE